MAKDIKKSYKNLKKLNKDFFKEEKLREKSKIPYAKLNQQDKYIGVNLNDVEEDMTYWDLIVKLWNKSNEEKVPKNIHKPYYRNFIEYIDTSRFANKYLDGGYLYIKTDQERIPNFHYRLKTGEDFCILFEKPEYMEPIPRKLTEKEIANLIKVLKMYDSSKYLKKKNIKLSYWDRAIKTWQYQNYEGNEYSPEWFPQYKNLPDNLEMPDYTKLNENGKNLRKV